MRAGGRLKVQVPLDELQRLASYPAPTYIIGIDARAETGYIVSANDAPTRSLASLPTTFPLDCQHLALLWQEVTTFWQQRPMQLHRSAFRAS